MITYVNMIMELKLHMPNTHYRFTCIYKQVSNANKFLTFYQIYKS